MPHSQLDTVSVEEDLSSRLRSAMNGRSVEWLAARSGVGERTIWRIVSRTDPSRKGAPDTDTLVKLARTLGVKVGWLIEGEGS